MFSIERKKRLLRILHNGFRKWYPSVASLLKLKMWEGEAWNRLALPGWEKTVTLNTDDGLKIKVRLNYLTDLTAVFGRPEEAQLDSIIKRLPLGGVFVDAGAHIGRYTLMAAKVVGPSGKVYAFEPAPNNCALLRENCILNSFHWVEAVGCALGAEEGKISLISGSDAATNTIVSDWYSTMQLGGDLASATKTEVDVKRLDELLEEKKVLQVDLLKVDVEGAEMLLFQGLDTWLELRRIKTIICEVHSPSVKMRELTDLLSKYNFNIREVGGAEIFAELKL